MSVKIHVTSTQKTKVAQVLKAIAEWIEQASNEAIILDLDLTFVKDC